MNSQEILALLGLVAAAEPAVLGYIKTLLESSKGQTGDQFLASADATWAKIKADALAELPPPKA
jgi:hypothetical protein